VPTLWIYGRDANALRLADRFVAVITRDGRAEHSYPCGTAVEAVRWAERVRLT
jgi:hypothetical protein